jgi:DNA invertase Pin-like site-specific DNA recombinase
MLLEEKLNKKQSVRWKIALYVRLSKEESTDESLSIAHQKKILHDYLEGFDESFTVTDMYIDDGLTGTTDFTRPAFQRMIKDIESRKVNCVIVKDLSRAFRNYADQGRFLENYFPRRNVRFISLSLPALDSYKNPEAMNSILVPIQGVINDNHCRETSLKIRAVFDLKKKKGEFLGGFAPYGYIRNPDDHNKFIIDEDAAQIVKTIFDWFVKEGIHKSRIAKLLNKMGVPNPTRYKESVGMKYKNPHSGINDGLWVAATITRILENAAYLGHMVQGRSKLISYKVHTQVAVPKEDWVIVKNMHPPIVSEELFGQAQKLLERNVRTSPGNKRLYPFSGLLYCADCKRLLGRRKSKNYVYYGCRTYTDKAGCTSHTIRLDVLEQAVLAAIRRQIELIRSISEVIAGINEAGTRNLSAVLSEKNISAKDRDLGSLLRMKDSLYLDWKNGDITREDYLRMKQSFDEQTGKLKALISDMKDEYRKSENGITPEHPYLASFIKHKNIESLNRGILVELINAIYLHEGGELTIEFNFAGHHEQIVDFYTNSLYNEFTEANELC